MKEKKAIKQYFNLSAGNYCGMILEKKLGIKAAKLLYRQAQEIKELLADNLDETEIAHWTLAHPDGKQTTVHYYEPNTSDKDKLDRIKLFSKDHFITKLDDVFIAESMDEAESIYLDYHGIEQPLTPNNKGL